MSRIPKSRVCPLHFPVERSQRRGPEGPFGPEQSRSPEEWSKLSRCPLQRRVSLGQGRLVAVSSRVERALQELGALGTERWQPGGPVPAVTAQPCCAQSHFPKCLIILQLKNKKLWLLLLIQLPG